MTSSRPRPPQLRGAASTVLAPLAGTGPLRLREVARTSLSVHYETEVPAVPVLCVATADAVRLPNCLVVDRLPPRTVTTPGPCVHLAPTRWWRPDRPEGLRVPPRSVLRRLPRPPYGVLDPLALVGRGAGLTPEGDDVLAAALVTAHATADPRLAGWRRRTRVALATRRTTAVSRGLLQHALEGYAVPQLAGLLRALAEGPDDDRLEQAVARLRAVGGTSGHALLAGVTLTLTTRCAGRGADEEGAA